MLTKFRAYQLSVQFYKSCEKMRVAEHLKIQLVRASSSISLNLAEGSERVSLPDKRRFYRMAMASIRECQAILDLVGPNSSTGEAVAEADKLGASVFKLLKHIDANLMTNGNRALGAERRDQKN